MAGLARRPTRAAYRRRRKPSWATDRSGLRIRSSVRTTAGRAQAESRPTGSTSAAAFLVGPSALVAFRAFASIVSRPLALTACPSSTPTTRSRVQSRPACFAPLSLHVPSSLRRITPRFSRSHLALPEPQRGETSIAWVGAQRRPRISEAPFEFFSPLPAAGEGPGVRGALRVPIPLLKRVRTGPRPSAVGSEAAGDLFLPYVKNGSPPPAGTVFGHRSFAHRAFPDQESVRTGFRQPLTHQEQDRDLRLPWFLGAFVVQSVFDSCPVPSHQRKVSGPDFPRSKPTTLRAPTISMPPAAGLAARAPGFDSGSPPTHERLGRPPERRHWRVKAPPPVAPRPARNQTARADSAPSIQPQNRDSSKISFLGIRA
jgi:hypothetical protein